jgi:hypothetical protein
MRRLLPHRVSAVVGVAAIAVGGAAGVVSAGAAVPARPAAAAPGLQRAQLTAVRVLPAPGGYTQVPQALPAAASAAKHAQPLPKVILPDLFAVTSRGITAAELIRLGRLPGVRSVITVNGGAVKIKGRTVSTIGVNAAAFRSWTPPQTSAQQDAWTALSRGELVTTAAAAKTLRLRSGSSYQVSGATQPVVRFGRAAAIGIPGVDAVVGARTSQALGLVPQIGVLISAPGTSLAALDTRIRGVIGSKTQFVSLRPAQNVAVRQGQLPIDGGLSAGRPTSYLELFRASARLYCPQLSWTVLAAIGQIESGDGQNMGPSSAGALGPMQFLPSTWSVWGINAFGTTGAPNIMSPYDAVPAAASYLCASGASQGAAGYPAAIFSYNHAAWYVAEVLALAHEYAKVYG